MSDNNQQQRRRTPHPIDIDHPKVQQAAAAILAAAVYGNPKELNRVHAPLAVAAARWWALAPGNRLRREPEAVALRRAGAAGPGLPLVAGNLARAALDTHLRGLVADLGRDRQYNGLRPLIDALRSLGVIPAARAKTLKHLVRIGNRAAHNYATLSADVEEMIREVRALVAEE